VSTDSRARSDLQPLSWTTRLIGKVSQIGRTGPQFPQHLRPIRLPLGEEAIYGTANVPRRHKRGDIERAFGAGAASEPSSQRTLERSTSSAANMTYRRHRSNKPAPRSIEEYRAFWDFHAQQSVTDFPSTERSSELADCAAHIDPREQRSITPVDRATAGEACVVMPCGGRGFSRNAVISHARPKLIMGG
jgi:hypothetical protein